MDKVDKIITHVNVDLDAALSLAAAREFIPSARKAEIVFLPANYNGEVGRNTLILDMDAGGRGVKGVVDPDGKVHSCFKTIVGACASEEDQKALASLVKFVDTQDTEGSVVEYFISDMDWEVKQMFGDTGLNAVLRGLQAFHKRDDRVVCERMEEIFLGRLYAGRARQKAEVEADQVPILHNGKVAVVSNARYMSTSGLVFAKFGVRIVIYQDGNSIGLLRRTDETLCMDHEVIRQVVREAGEENEWFAHSTGRQYSRGTRKSPRATPSRVDPYLLAEAAFKALEIEAAAQEVGRQESLRSIRNSAEVL